MKELLLSSIWFALNDGELALIASYLMAATTRATTGFFQTLAPQTKPWGTWRLYLVFSVLTSSEA